MSDRSKEISVFVDESGSFDSSAHPSRYYIVCLVFHDQDVSIAHDIELLERHLVEFGLPTDHCVHAGPLVRREQDYSAMSRDERRLIFTRMMAFIRHLDITYRCFAVDKKFITKTDAIQEELLRQMSAFLFEAVAKPVDATPSSRRKRTILSISDATRASRPRANGGFATGSFENHATFDAYDALKIYYDNGQGQIKELLKKAFDPFSSKVEFVSEVAPEKYRRASQTPTRSMVEFASALLPLHSLAPGLNAPHAQIDRNEEGQGHGWRHSWAPFPNRF